MSVLLPDERPDGPAHGLTPEEVRRRYLESRAAQGLGPVSTDGAALDRLAALLLDVGGA